jgi:sugar phosphate isomerase/epimerase
MTNGDGGERRWFTNLSPGGLGLELDFDSVVELAHGAGFDAVEPDTDYLEALPERELDGVRERLAARGLRFGPGFLPIDLAAEAVGFAQGLSRLARLAERLRRVGVDRLNAWIAPGSDVLTYRKSFGRLVERLAAVDELLAPAGIRLGLEYVGPRTARSALRFEFVHTLRELRELVAAVGRPNLGYVVDAFHWYTAGEAPEEISALPGRDVVDLHLSDAPAGVERDAQEDLVRLLPGATGVIDLDSLLRGLKAGGYAGPVTAEPFDHDLRGPAAERVELAAASLRSALERHS